MTPIVVMVITMATITVLVTRPGVALAIDHATRLMSGAIKAQLGTDRKRK